MRILTSLAQPDLKLAQPVTANDGSLLFCKGTVLARRHLRELHAEGLRFIHVEPDPRIQEWETVPDVDDFMRTLDHRFGDLEEDPRMQMVRQSIQRVYLDFLFELEG